MTREADRWRAEIVGGLTTFATTTHVLFVSPAILGDPAGAGMDRGAVLVAAMGLHAGYPIAVARGMGRS